MPYFDSAYLAKFYLNEPESDSVRQTAAELGDIAASIIARAEVVSVFHRKLREGVLPPEAFAALLAQFEADCTAGLWRWLPMTDEILLRVNSAYRGLPATVFLRAADAMHLATAAEAGIAEIWSNDRTLVAAAPHFGLRARTVPVAAP